MGFSFRWPGLDRSGNSCKTTCCKTDACGAAGTMTVEISGAVLGGHCTSVSGGATCNSFNGTFVLDNLGTGDCGWILTRHFPQPSAGPPGPPGPCSTNSAAFSVLQLTTTPTLVTFTICGLQEGAVYKASGGPYDPNDMSGLTLSFFGAGLSCGGSSTGGSNYSCDLGHLTVKVTTGG
jgi:hypothetical protein